MKKEDLRIVFMGTPEFAVETLQTLVDHGYPVVAVVTKPDKAVGRHGSVLQASAVKQYALAHGIPVLQPERMKDEQFIEALRSYRANLQIVVAFRMLPEVVWAMPEYGTFNVHAALLPQYRGAAPINWAIINGERQTGVTTFFLDHDIDTGRIIMSRPFDIPDEADVEYVYDGLMHLGAQLCLDTVDCIVAADGHPTTTVQTAMDGEELKGAPKLFKENCGINWQQPAKRVYDFVRGLCPVPGAWSSLVAPDGKTTLLKVYRTAKTGQSATPARPGTLCLAGRQLLVATGDEWLRLEELQLAGKKRMTARDFLNGMKDLEQCRVE